MSAPRKLELISFKTCPFVQRSVIALNEKGVDYTLTHIDLDDLPDWFKAISPLGKVPVLLVDDKPVFESAVILEYLDEVYPPRLHPQDPLEKAVQRAWVEFNSDLNGRMYQLTMAKDEAGYQEPLNALKTGIQRLDSIVASEPPFFAGKELSLVDCVYAPLFMRLDVLKQRFNIEVPMSTRINQWKDALLARASVKNSVVSDFETLFVERLQKKGSYIATHMMA